MPKRKESPYSHGIGIPGIPILPPGNSKCACCALCSFTYKSNGTIMCSSNHVIYLIRCPCGLAYVGKTSRSLRIHICECCIRTGDMRITIASQFKSAAHNVSALQYIGIEKVTKPLRGGDYERKLLQREWDLYFKHIVTIRTESDFYNVCLIKSIYFP